MCRYGTQIYTETVSKVDLKQGAPFQLETDSRVVQADAVIVATGDKRCMLWRRLADCLGECPGLYRWMKRSRKKL